MGNKSKIIIIILGIVSVAIGFITLRSIYNYNIEKKKHTEDIKKFNQEKKDLQQLMEDRVSQLRGRVENAQKNLGDLQKELSVASSERDNWRDRYELALREKGTLVEKITELEEAQEKKTEAEGQVVPTAYALSDDSYWASVLRAKASLEIRLSEASKQFSEVVIRIEELTKQNNELSFELNKFSQIKADLERQIAYSQKLSNTLSEELVREKNDKEKYIEQSRQIKRDYAAIQQQLRNVTDERITLAKQTQELKEEKRVLTKKLSEMDQVMQDRTDEIAQIKDRLVTIRPQTIENEEVAGSTVVELPAIVVKATGTPQLKDLEPKEKEDLKTKKDISGSVLAVNKENNFVVIDIGESSGVKQGMTFGVHRKELQIASIKIIQTRSDVSAADIEYLQRDQQIKVGDIVR